MKSKPIKPKRQRPLRSTVLLAALHRRFKENGKEEAYNVLLMRKKRKAIAAHDASIRGATWFCAANVIDDVLAENPMNNRTVLRGYIVPVFDWDHKSPARLFMPTLTKEPVNPSDRKCTIIIEWESNNSKGQP